MCVCPSGRVVVKNVAKHTLSWQSYLRVVSSRTVVLEGRTSAAEVHSLDIILVACLVLPAIACNDLTRPSCRFERCRMLIISSSFVVPFSKVRHFFIPSRDSLVTSAKRPSHCILFPRSLFASYCSRQPVAFARYVP